jgi:autotransporter-associated beta strand protein
MEGTGTLNGGQAVGGAGGSPSGGVGFGYGAGIFIQGDQSITFAPGAGATVTISDAIADMTGSHDPSNLTRAGSVIVNGAGTLILAAANTYGGATTIAAGTLEVDGSIESGATLGGTGTAGAVTVESGGAFAPGDPSTFTVASHTQLRRDIR